MLIDYEMLNSIQRGFQIPGNPPRGTFLYFIFITRSWANCARGASLLHDEIYTVENGTIGAVENIDEKRGKMLGSFCLKREGKKKEKQSTARLNLVEWIIPVEYHLLRD